VSRFDRLRVDTADGSGDVSVIREPVTGLNNVYLFFFNDFYVVFNYL
jgi:hypothetical protein